jgi:hypothetical protein
MMQERADQVGRANPQGLLAGPSPSQFVRSKEDAHERR